MGQKDILEKRFENNKDVFADIVNGLMWKGKQRIRPEDLIDKLPRQDYWSEEKGMLCEKERDVVKGWYEGDIQILSVGFENQTKFDEWMPLRVFGYEGNEYNDQLRNENKDKPFYPVITLVLYFGVDQPWRGPRTLKEALKISPEMEPYVNDCKLNLFEIAYLPDEIVENLKGDFRFVVDYLIQTRKNENYQVSIQELDHPEDTWALLSEITGDPGFKISYNNNREGAPKTMKLFMSEVKAEGKAEERKDIALHCAKMDMPVQNISRIVRVSVDEIEKWIKEAGLDKESHVLQ